MVYRYRHYPHTGPPNKDKGRHSHLRNLTVNRFRSQSSRFISCFTEDCRAGICAIRHSFYGEDVTSDFRLGDKFRGLWMFSRFRPFIMVAKMDFSRDIQCACINLIDSQLSAYREAMGLVLTDVSNITCQCCHYSSVFRILASRNPFC